MSVLDKNQPYEALPDTFIIFFCTFDYLEQDLPVYTFKTLCTENTAQGSHQKALETAKILKGISKNSVRFLEMPDEF